MDIVKRHLSQIRRSYRRYQRKVGTTIVWYEYDPTGAAPANIYDEAPAERWKHGFELHILAILRDEDVEGPREEGFYTGGRAHVTFGTDQAAQDGMTDPHNAVLHLKDRFYWDGEYWTVNTFQISGRLHRAEVVIGVDAQRLAAEELVNIPDFPPSPGD